MDMRVSKTFGDTSISPSDEPVITGFHVSGGGSTSKVIRFRRGLDACSIPRSACRGNSLARSRSARLKASGAMKGQQPAYEVAVMLVRSARGAHRIERLRI